MNIEMPPYFPLFRCLFSIVYCETPITKTLRNWQVEQSRAAEGIIPVISGIHSDTLKGKRGHKPGRTALSLNNVWQKFCFPVIVFGKKVNRFSLSFFAHVNIIVNTFYL